MTSTTAAEDPLPCGTKSIAVICTRQQRGEAKKHIGDLPKEERDLTDLHQCNDIGAFKDINIAMYNRLDILVDTRMCTMLMKKENLHEAANEKFEVIDEKDGQINIINLFAQDFDLFYSRLPKNVKNVIEHGGGIPQNVQYVTSTIGMAGNSKAEGSVIIGEGAGDHRNLIVNINDPFGSYSGWTKDNKFHFMRKEIPNADDTANNSPSAVDMKFRVPKGKDDQILSKFIENKENIAQTTGVRQAEVSHGCVMLTLMLKKGHIVTEKWVQDVLRMLYDDILASCISEGETFDVDVQRRVQYNFNIPPDPKLHENCISQTEHQQEIKDLQEEKKLLVDQQNSSILGQHLRIGLLQTVSDRVVMCSVCQNIFNDPVTLFCQHSLCRGCATGIIMSQKEPISTVKCPECREFTSVPDPTKSKIELANQFKPSLILKKIYDLVLEEREKAGLPPIDDQDNSSDKKTESAGCTSTCPEETQSLDAIKIQIIENIDPKMIIHHLCLKEADEEKIVAVQNKQGRRAAAIDLLRLMESTCADWIDTISQALRNPNVGLKFLADNIDAEKMKFRVQGTGDPTTGKEEETSVHPESSDTCSVTPSVSGLIIGAVSGISHQKSAVEKILENTIHRVEIMTHGMVRTAALDNVMSKLNCGETWITIKGSPGEGKTTVAFMALDELYKSGKQVFCVHTPEELAEVTTGCSRPVILLDDIFGSIAFDMVSFKQWKDILFKTMITMEHKVQKHTSRTEVTIILVGRDYVLKSASRHMGELGKFLMDNQYVVDMTGGRGPEEKLAIWRAVVEEYDMHIRDDTRDRIFEMKSHGFPHLCRIFVAMARSDHPISVEDFFRSPMIFLNQTISCFLRDRTKLNLFKHMLKRDGRISFRELENLEYGVDAAHDLLDTYLNMENDDFVFAHPSIYESVAYNLCRVSPLFVIEHCSLSFISDRIRLESSHATHQIPESVSTICLPRSYSVDLARRFVSEISHRNLSQVLSHQAFSDDVFVNVVMSQLTSGLTELIALTDSQSGDTFLSLVASSKAHNLLKYIDNHTHPPLTEIDVKMVLYGVWRFAASDALSYLLQTPHRLDVNYPYGEARKTPLMIAASTRDSQFVQQILRLNPEMGARDSEGKTALHYLCVNHLVSAVEQSIDMGIDVNVTDHAGHTPLFYATESGQLDMVKLLLDHGASISGEP